MGLKLQGLLLKKDYSNDPILLLNEMGLESVHEIKRATFGNYWHGFQSKEHIILSFYNNATIINCDPYFVSNEYIKCKLSHDTEVSAFVEYDTINAFAYDFFRNGKMLRRSYFDRAAGKTNIQKGEFLPFEEPKGGAERNFYNLSKYYLGTTLDDGKLHDNALAIEYRFNFKYPNVFQNILNIGKHKRHTYWIQFYGNA